MAWYHNEYMPQSSTRSISIYTLRIGKSHVIDQLRLKANELLVYRRVEKVLFRGSAQLTALGSQMQVIVRGARPHVADKRQMSTSAGHRVFQMSPCGLTDGTSTVTRKWFNGDTADGQLSGSKNIKRAPLR